MEVDASKDTYVPPPEFKETNEDPLSGISLNDSTELWLIQLPTNQLKPVDFDGKELKLKLRRDGRLGSLENSAGQSFDIVTSGSHQPNATVFMPGSSTSKIVGKISRRVSLVNYDVEANPLLKPHARRLSLLSRSSDGTPSSLNRTISRGSGALSHSSRQRSSQMVSGTSFEGGEVSHPPKERRADRSPSSKNLTHTEDLREGLNPGSLLGSASLAGSSKRRSSQGLSETSFESGEASHPSTRRPIDHSPSSQDSKRTRDLKGSIRSGSPTPSHSQSKKKSKRTMALEE